MQRRQSSSRPEGASTVAGAIAELRQRLAGRESLGRSVQAALEQMIEGGVLKPGARLNEMELAAQLGVSRGPVREAARALERTGLVTVILNRGAFVRSLDIDEVLQTYEMNAVLFGHAAALLARRIAPVQAAELQASVARMDEAAAAGGREAFFAANVLFHQRVVEFCGNRPLRDVYLEHTRRLLLLRRRSFDAAGNMRAANSEHHRLLEAILSGQAELARHQAEAHTRAGRARYLAAIAHGSAAAAGETMPEGGDHHADD
ncbi:FCD domain-containing protein [Roseomonas sp. M0104]|uniref:FCD domain-containing protein n=1 Tax=Teichococcus coralli TaxID=2545983 RepID=A0A845BJD0_9PROT|nr:FCD domain-containing protein [Pseudoroseomonas coralli]MXP65282.1 FCD domain-containing protein [Pseudoroseomonas coralli]